MSIRARRRSGSIGVTLVRERVLSEGFINVFLRRLDNRTVAKLFTRHLPEVRRALIAAPTSNAFVTGVPHAKTAVDAAITGNGAKASKAVAEFWTKGLVTVVDEFAAPTVKEGR